MYNFFIRVILHYVAMKDIGNNDKRFKYIYNKNTEGGKFLSIEKIRKIRFKNIKT